MIYLHLGAGAGDLDERANFRCGFTELIKSKFNEGDKIYIIEANPINIKKLRETYKDYIDTKIFNIGISEKNEKELKFYYAEHDAPHFQVCSAKIEHVKKHHPNSKINFFKIETISINNFLENYIKNQTIDYLSIDIEGLDFEVLMSINLKKYNIKNISIEYLHLSKFQKRNMINKLIKFGYSYCGYGYDHNNYDFLFVKKKIFINQLLSKVLWIIGRKHLAYFNCLIKRP